LVDDKNTGHVFVFVAICVMVRPYVSDFASALCQFIYSLLEQKPLSENQIISTASPIPLIGVGFYEITSIKINPK